MNVMVISAIVYVVGCACCIRSFRKRIYHNEERVLGSIKIALSWVVMYAYLSFFWYGGMHLSEISQVAFNIWSMLYASSLVIGIFIIATIIVLSIFHKILNKMIYVSWESIMGSKGKKFIEILVKKEEKLEKKLYDYTSEWGIAHIILMLIGFLLEFMIMLEINKRPITFFLLSIIIVGVTVDMYNIYCSIHVN